MRLHLPLNLESTQPYVAANGRESQQDNLSHCPEEELIQVAKPNAAVD